MFSAMFRKKKSTSKGDPSVPRAAVSQQQSVPLHLDINRSPLFARRNHDREAPTSQSSFNQGAHPQHKPNTGISRQPLSVSASVPLTLPLEPFINISPVVTKVRTPQLKEVLGGSGFPSGPSGSEHTSPVYADVYEPGQTSSESSLTSPQQEAGAPLPSRDGELTPLTPITPLGFFDSVNKRASDFTVRSGQTAQVRSPTLPRQSSNAVVFDNLQSLLESPEAVDNAFPSLPIRSAAPKKLVTTRVSLIPHPPIEPVDISSIAAYLPGTDAASDPTAGMIGEGTASAKADVIARKQQQPLPPLPIKNFKQSPSTSSNSLFPTNSVGRDQTDHTYQPIDRHSRSSGSNLSIHSGVDANSSLNRDGSDTGQKRGVRIVNEVTLHPPDGVSVSALLPQHKSHHGSKNTIQTTSLDQLSSVGPSSPPWSTPDDVASPESDEIGDLTRPSSMWSRATQSRFTQFMSRNSSTLSMMPQDKIESLFRDRYMGKLNLEEVLEEQPPDFLPPPPASKQNNTGMSLESMVCTRCGEGFEPQEKIVNSNGQLWHTQCFVCSQCFRAFPDDVFYEFEGRRYCEHDFQVLFAPCCGKCNEFIIGRVIKAMNNNWHPRCFTCSECSKELADLGFIRNMGHAVCHDCNARLKAQSLNKYMCHKCHSVIDGEPLRWRGDTYHPYHFNCANCEVELTHQAREVKSRPGYTANQMNELYCLRCHDKMGIPICGACRRPIEERVVTALGKHWHVEHFVCIKCEKPFFGNRHYEKKGQAYCEVHYHELFGNLCFVCNQVIYGDVVTALNKAWCTHHFACTLCDCKMTQKSKFFEFDQKPICKKCYEKLPQELKKRLKRQHDIQARGGKTASV